jgi:hypothetical protein
MHFVEIDFVIVILIGVEASTVPTACFQKSAENKAFFEESAVQVLVATA